MSNKKLLMASFILVILLACSFPLSSSGEEGEPVIQQQSNPSEGENATAVENTMVPSNSPGMYYIRPDGGSFQECTGFSDAPYPGSGQRQDCAWNHPFVAFPPGENARTSGGSTLIIAPGIYRMGIDAPGSENCEPENAYDCTMAAIPSGPDPDHPTRFLGAGWDTECNNPPELWGAERASFVLNLTDSSNIEIGCLEITDHSECIESHSGGLACEYDQAPFGDWAKVGLYAEDSSNVYLHDLNIHGLSNAGIHAGRLTDWLVENVRLAYNGWAGWDGDLWDDLGDDNHGTLTFRHFIVEWNGCSEGISNGEPIGCWGQTAGGYGDGFAPGASGGDWVFEDSAFLHNTSDGVDMLYHTLGGSAIFNRVRAEGNAGNQIKVTGAVQILNSLLVGNCAFFEGQEFTHNLEPCRALGNALHIALIGGEQATIRNSTIYGEGDGLILAGPHEEKGTCHGDESISVFNSMFIGDTDFTDSSDITFLFYQEGCGNLKLTGDYNLAVNVKNTDAEFINPPFPSAHNLLADPRLEGTLTGEQYGMRLLSGSPAIDAGSSEYCPDVDITGSPRSIDGDGDGQASCDIGAYEYTP